jgi:hypothetical protein
MIERLKESGGPAFGFKVTGPLTSEDVAVIAPQIEFAISSHKTPIGLLADLSDMQGASWSARWEEMRFLQRHTTRISRMAVVSDSKWEEIAEMIVVASAVLQAETLYFHSTEILQAWHWAKMSKFDDRMRPHYVSGQRFIPELHSRNTPVCDWEQLRKRTFTRLPLMMESGRFKASHVAGYPSWDRSWGLCFARTRLEPEFHSNEVHGRRISELLICAWKAREGSGLLSMMEVQVVGAAKAMAADKYGFAPAQGIFAPSGQRSLIPCAPLWHR